MVFILTALSPFNVVANRFHCYSVVQVALISEIVIHTRHMIYNVVTSVIYKRLRMVNFGRQLKSVQILSITGILCRSMFMTTFYDWQGHAKGPLCM